MANQNEYGLMDLLDLHLINPNDPVRVVDSDLLSGGILIDNAQHNADINAVLNLLSTTTENYTEEVQQYGGSRNQPLDEKGRSIPMKPGVPYTVAFPLIASGNAWGDTWAARQKMKVKDLARIMSKLYIGDYNWVVDHALATIFQADGYSHVDPLGRGTLTIEGLANGDATTYYRTSTGSSAVDTHILAQSGAIADNANPYPTIKDELLEHADNGGEVIAFIATSLVATTSALAEFNSATLDADITLGTDTDRLTGTLNATLPPGAMVKGKTDSGVWIVEWPRLPADYIVAVCTEGERPLARRVDPDFGDGFLVRGEREDWPLHETQLSRWQGFGGRNRVGAVAYLIGNSGTYAVPTNYAVPMP